MVIEIRKPLTAEALLTDDISTDIGHWMIEDECNGQFTEFTIDRGIYNGTGFDNSKYILAKYTYKDSVKGTMYDTPSITILGYRDTLPATVELYNKYINEHADQVGDAIQESTHASLQSR